MKHFLHMFLCLLCTHTAHAQQIDFNQPNDNPSQYLEEGYEAWGIPTQQQPATKTFGGVTFTVEIEGDVKGKTLYTVRWKDGRQHSKLICDGVMVKGLDEQGNRPELTTGRVGIKVHIAGLPNGNHTLLAYHNNTDGGDFVAPPISIDVDGVTKVTGIQQTRRATSLSESAKSSVEFTVTDQRPVTITYYTVPVEGTTYTTTSLELNSLEVGGDTFMALDPTPANNDRHAAWEDGKASLSWKAPDGTAKHHLVFGTDSMAVVNATTYDYEGTAASWQTGQLSPLTRYFWRMDEEDAQGKIHHGTVWSFQPRRKAFPDAEGYGQYAVGGRGGIVYHVTSLDDDATNPQPGTFRYGITQVKGPRTIVFDVAGVIHLKARLTCSEKYVTVAGQTAPGNGILFRGAPFGMQSDGITRFIRLYRGHIIDAKDAQIGIDGMGMAGNDHAIMDHCSISWTIDEGFSSRNAKAITLQRTIISEALNCANHPNYGTGTQHGYAATIGSGQMGGLPGSFHHNLLAHNEGRNWSISGGLDGTGNYDGHHDVFNNVVYNWGSRATDGGSHEINFVNNYYKMGPATTMRKLFRHQFEGTGSGTQAAYVKGNIREEPSGLKVNDKEGDTYIYELSNGQVLNWEPWATKPFFESYAEIETAESAYKSVLSDVGCNMPTLNKHDARIIDETRNGSTSTTGSKTGKKGLIDHEEDSEGFDAAKLGITTETRPTGFDTDMDGIPDWFEEIAGTDKNVANNNDDRDGDHYTDLEEYLDWMAHPNFIVKVGDTKSIDLKPYFAGYPSFTATIANSVSGATIEDNSLNMVTTVKGFYTVRVKVSDGSDSMVRQFNFAVTDGTTGIEHVKTDEEQTDGPIYDLQGRRIQRPSKGIYIQNGQKRLAR